MPLPDSVPVPCALSPGASWPEPPCASESGVSQGDFDGFFAPPQAALLVTGAAKRIGRAVAESAAKAGWAVLLHCQHSQAEAEEAAHAIKAAGGLAAVVQADLADPAQIAQMWLACDRSTTQWRLPLRAVVNNASRFSEDAATSCSVAQWDAHMHTNVRAPMLLAQGLYARVCAQWNAAQSRTAQPPGCVVNILDQKVFNLNPDFFSYTVSKLALEGLTRMQALSLAPQLRVCGVAPGLTLQSGSQSAANFAQAHRASPLGYGSQPQDIAQAVLYLLAAQAVTGCTLIVDGGQHLVPMKRDVMYEIEEQ